jgi:type I restriction enzyme, S subunit
VLQDKPTHWVEVPIGEILKHLDNQVVFDDMAEYLTITVKRRHGGLEAREKLFGHEIKTKKQYRLHRGAFIISRVQCWHAAFAIVPDDIPENMIASQNYDQFEISPKVDNRFFWWLSHSPQFIETVRSSASGVVIEKLVFNRDVWLQKTVPLPPLDEQRRLVAHIESIAAQVNEAQHLRETADEEADVIVSSALFHIFDTNSQHWKSIPMAEAIEINDRQVDPTLPEYSILPHISGENMESKTCRLLPYRTAEADGIRSSNYLFSPNTILYSKIRPYLRKAVYVDFQGVCSADVYPIKVNNPELDIQFVMWSLVANPFSEYANTLSGRTRMPKLNRKQLFSFTFKHPPLDEQRRIVAYLDGLQAKVSALRELQSASGEELSALMPSVLDRAFKGEL